MKKVINVGSEPIKWRNLLKTSESYKGINPYIFKWAKFRKKSMFSKWIEVVKKSTEAEWTIRAKGSGFLKWISVIKKPITQKWTIAD